MRPLRRLTLSLVSWCLLGSCATPARAVPDAAWLSIPNTVPLGTPVTRAAATGLQVDVTITTGGTQGVHGTVLDTLGRTATALDYDSLRCVAIFNGGGSSAVTTTLTFSNIQVGAGHQRGLLMIGAVNGQSSPVTLTSSVAGRVSTFTVLGEPFDYTPSNSHPIAWNAANGQFTTDAFAGIDSKCIVLDLGDLRDDGTLTVTLQQHLSDGIVFGFGEQVGMTLDATPALPATAVALAAPRPSPARASVELAFVAGTTGPARLEVLDVSGRRVASLLDAPIAAGPHALRWDLRDADGRPVAPGVLLVRLVTADGIATRRLLVVR